MSSIIIIIPVVNQPIAGRQAVARTKANENHTPAIFLGARKDFMISVMGVRHSRNPVGRRADGCNRNECSGSDPSYIGEGSEGLLGGGCCRCGRCCVFHWSRLFKTLVNFRPQKRGELLVFCGELLPTG